MSKDIRVLIIKLSDRLPNLRTINYMTHDKIVEKCQETLDIYAPLAARLGMYAFKFEMEDISFKNLMPEEYAKLDKEMSERRKNSEGLIQAIIDQIHTLTDELGIKAEIYGRSKHYYSIYKKMKYQQRDLDEIFDLTAVRVIVDSVKDCYAVLGAVHTKWKPIPGRFKDYIAMPKPNKYQSLHTTVIGDNGNPFEIQIRTWEMHRVAEYGVAAHWKYKEGVQTADEEVRIAWLRQALEWQQESSDSTEFVETLKMELFSNQVFVFTPKGDVKELPAGSTPLDFAFKVHTNVGLRCVGAKVNGRIVTLDHVLKNGDIVEILTNKSSKGPSSDWLKIARTNSARTKIRQFLNKQERDQISEREKEKAQKEKEKAHELELQRQQVAIERKEAEEILQGDKKGPRHSTGTKGVSVKGVDNLYVRFARCCNPVPGDAIIGYTTKGRGVSIHRKDCVNMLNLPQNEIPRLIEVSWAETDQPMYFDAAIQIIADDRKGLVADISKICEDMDVNINGLNIKSKSDGILYMEIILAITSTSDILKLESRFRQVRNVSNVFRSNT
ncbi:MAG: bifunctional (p)ppGpp synthetase/guanosine-3',5'-bis(diphosphate) 3'-pyrophosphohydrolase, partial [Firmicutes bacterium]|nr:bifunctional (p)ppGpp synthetase/guanosine-3',5'-bis(diphosphate) 3'-pyrophosphohydrolase [Bacillota bacterium]